MNAYTRVSPETFNRMSDAVYNDLCAAWEALGNAYESAEDDAAMRAWITAPENYTEAKALVREVTARHY